MESVAFDRSVDVEAPFHWGDVAWYNRGPKPGDQGHAVIYGHVDSTCCPAVFWHLKDLRRGDIVTVWYRKGRPLSFKIQWLHTYPNVQVPMKWIYSSTKQRALVLETCAGVFHRDGTGYDHKLVAYATMVTRRH